MRQEKRSIGAEAYPPSFSFGSRENTDMGFWITVIEA
jgi:hypothetical protein